jgi:small subunit ribosomal protein S4
VYRLGLAPTRAAARQLVSHCHITVDGKVCNIASYIVKPGQTVGVREKDRTMSVIVESLKNPRTMLASWLQWDEGNMTGTLLSVPERAEIPENIDVQLIVELYSR